MFFRLLNFRSQATRFLNRSVVPNYNLEVIKNCYTNREDVIKSASLKSNIPGVPKYIDTSE